VSATFSSRLPFLVLPPVGHEDEVLVGLLGRQALPGIRGAFEDPVVRAGQPSLFVQRARSSPVERLEALVLLGRSPIGGGLVDGSSLSGDCGSGRARLPIEADICLCVDCTFVPPGTLPCR